MQQTTLFGGLFGDDKRRYLGQLAEGFIATQVVAVTARLGVPDLLADADQTAEELAGAIGAEPDPLERLLRAAAGFGLLTQDENDRFTLTEVGQFLRTDATGGLRDFIVGFTGPPLWQSMGQLENVVRNGHYSDATDDAASGMWAYYQHHPEEARWFARAMSSLTTRLAGEVVTAYDPSGFERIVDVGGSRGTLLMHLLRRAPQATGVLWDRSEALEEAPTVLAEGGVADRTEVVAGDFLEAVPRGGDLYVISQVLHNWEDEQARTIVSNCHRASQPDSTLLVIEPLLPTDSQPSPMHVLDLLMMVGPGGRERSREQHEALLASAGYTLTRDIALTQGFPPWHILECRRT